MFSPYSRYAKAGTYVVARADGTMVTATRIPLPVARNTAGSHPHADAYRLDAIAAHYLADGTAFWQLCDLNGAIAPDALAAHERVDIPEKGR